MGYFGKIKDAIKPFFVEKSVPKQKYNSHQAFYDEEIRPGNRLCLALLLIALSVIIAKVFVDGVYHATIYKSTLEMNNKILNASCETFLSLLSHIWSFISRFQWILTPSLFAAGFVSFSWLVLYKDSDIPGVNPPTPFSPPRYRNQCTRSMDFSYALTGTFGLLIFIRLLYQSLRNSD